jgi:hypothetical protein
VIAFSARSCDLGNFGLNIAETAIGLICAARSLPARRMSKLLDYDWSEEFMGKLRLRQFAK